MESPRSSAFLERFYGGNFVPREKKTVVDLARSQGPFLRSIDEHPLQIIDAASQIASLPAGFRPDAIKSTDEGLSFLCSLISFTSELGLKLLMSLKILLDHGPPTTQHVCWTKQQPNPIKKRFILLNLRDKEEASFSL